MQKERIIYFDYLRIVASIAVIIIHVSGQNWNSISVKSINWLIFDVSDSLVRWAVPIFVMISGALFLNRDIEIKTIYKKNIKRLIIAFIFWSLVFVFTNRLYNEEYSFKDGFEDFFKGHYHMWYIFTIFALYLIVPFIREIIKSDKLSNYLLILSFIFSIIIPNALYFASVVSKPLGNCLDVLNCNVGLNIAKGYMFYFVFGYYMSQKELSSKQRKTIYLLGILGASCTVFFSIFTSIKDNVADKQFLENYMFGNFLETIAVFVLFKYKFNKPLKNERYNNIVLSLSKYTFGVYLCHPIFLDLLEKFYSFSTTTLTPFLSIPIITINVAVFSFLLSALLNRIPKLNKYIV